MKPRILFVDDEESILAAMRMVLHRERSRWDMVFAIGPDRALAELAAAPFDVVVSDMRMPKIDGGKLLAIVQERWPATIRIILSGHAEPDAIVRALPSLHQFLSKPCPPDTLRECIARVLAVSAVVTPEIRTAIARLDHLPSSPAVFAALTAMTTDVRGNLADVASLVAGDPSLAAKCLQLASSTAFGAGTAFESPDAAARYLGFDTLRRLVAVGSIFSASMPAVPLDLDAMQGASLVVSMLVRDLVTDEVAITAALLRDIGRIVLALGFPERYRGLGPEPSSAAERAEFGIDHAHAGSALLAIWGVSAKIVELVARHDDPPAGDRLAAAIHYADRTIRGDAVDRARMVELGISPAELDHWSTTAELYRDA